MPKVKSIKKSDIINPLVRRRNTNSGSQSTQAKKLIGRLEEEYKKNTNPKNAVAMKKYMRDQFSFYGLKAPERRGIDKLVLAEFLITDVMMLRDILVLTWQKPEREFQMFAIDIASKHKQLLSGDNPEICSQSLELMKTLITTKSWWDTVDMLASSVIGHMASEHPSVLNPVLDAWIEDDNLWLRRTAILYQLKYKDKTDQEKLFRYCLKTCHEEDFFIRKAIGWALREYFRTEPENVKRFVSNNQERLSTLSKKEALKHA